MDWIPRDVVWTESIEHVLASHADVVVELMGGLRPAYDLVRRALESGKSVVTANKQLIAHCGAELQQLANDNCQYLGFGACVAGGVPVLSSLQDGLAGDRIVQIRGILNGTCNYILSRIEKAGISFADALSEAQRAGFAEADPSFDIDGQDAGAKLAILARVGLKVGVSPDRVLCRTIRHLSAIDFEYAHELHCTIRQISTGLLRDGEATLPSSHRWSAKILRLRRFPEVKTLSSAPASSVAKRCSAVTEPAEIRRPSRSSPICFRLLVIDQTGWQRLIFRRWRSGNRNLMLLRRTIFASS